MPSDTPRTNEVWATADYDSHRRGTCEKLERELNEANLELAKISRKLLELILSLRTTKEEHAKKYYADRRIKTTPDAS